MASESKTMDPTPATHIAPKREYQPSELFTKADNVKAIKVSSATYLEGGIAGYNMDVELQDGTTYELKRSFTDFDAQYAKLVEEIPDVGGLPVPPPYPWFVKLKLMMHIDPRDFEALEIHRLQMDNWVKAVLANPASAKSATWSNILSRALRRDWPPTTGEIDLDVHDKQHETAITEWWYWNMHFTGEDGKEYSAFFCIFCKEKFINPLTADKYWGYACHAAFVDVERKKYYQRSILDVDAPEIIDGLIQKDHTWAPMLKRAYGEMLRKNQLPKPDELHDKQMSFGGDLDFSLFDCSCKKLKDGRYELNMSDTKGTTGFHVIVTPKKKPIRHGFNGVTKGHGGDDMFYYFIPRCDLEGSFHVEGGEEIKIAKGQAWYDHEFGGADTTEEEGTEMLPYAWSWCAVQLDNGFDISLCSLQDMANRTKAPEMFGKLVGPDSTVDSIEADTTFLPVMDGPWFQSRRTFQEAPLRWEVKSEKFGLDLVLEAAFQDQELMSIINQPGYWEGRMNVTGTFRGKPVKGLAFVERAGYNQLTDLNRFFKSVGKSVRSEVSKVFPDKFDDHTALQVVGRKGFEYYLDAVPYDVLHKTLVAPVRSIIDRGGKSWRSFASLACIDVVGGDSRDVVEVLAMPEFLHVGSLIIDDIQDESTIRRGGPACHTEFGIPVAINAGTACYFQFETVLTLLKEKFSAETLLKCYDEYFLCLRAGHAGQALDIFGLEKMMEDAIESGDGDLAERRVLATHRLKTAAPAGSLSRIGAVLGGGTTEQVKIIGEYFEGVGTAFQIMDDVLNLRGLYTTEADRKKGVQLKKLGEDLEAGKVTMPVVKAISLMKKEEIRKLWGVIKTKPTDPDVVWGLIQQLEDCGAISACVEQAKDMVESSWAALDPLLEPSFSKIMLRSFGWFVIERNL